MMDFLRIVQKIDRNFPINHTQDTAPRKIVKHAISKSFEGFRISQELRQICGEYGEFEESLRNRFNLSISRL
jgi:hypothetical protein